MSSFIRNPCIAHLKLIHFSLRRGEKMMALIMDLSCSHPGFCAVCNHFTGNHEIPIFSNERKSSGLPERNVIVRKLGRRSVKTAGRILVLPGKLKDFEGVFQWWKLSEILFQ